MCPNSGGKVNPKDVTIALNPKYDSTLKNRFSGINGNEMIAALDDRVLNLAYELIHANRVRTSEFIQNSIEVKPSTMMLAVAVTTLIGIRKNSRVQAQLACRV